MITARHVAALILLAAVLLPAAATAQERVVTLASRVTTFPEVGVSRDGDGVVAWFAHDEGTVWQRRIGSFFVASRDARGSVGTPRRLTPSGYASYQFALAVGSDGDAAVVLRRRGSSWRRPGDRLLVARRVPGGRFGRFTSVSGVRAVNKPAAAMGPDGTLLVAWLARAPRAGCGGVVHAAVARRRAPLGRVRRISGPCPHAAPPQAVAGRGGRGVVAWLEGGRNGRIAVAPATGGRFGEAVTLERGLTGANREFGLAGSDDGRALVVWREPIAPTFAERPGRVFAAEVGAGLHTRPVAVSASDNILAPASVAVAPSGAALVAWQEADWTHSSVVVARRAAGSDAFSAPEVVHPCGVDVQSWRGAVGAVASDGAAAVGFHSSCLHRPTRTAVAGLGVVRAPAGGSFGPALPLGGMPGAKRIRIALADAGPGLVAWTQRNRLQVLGL